MAFAVQSHQSNQLRKAEAIYRQVLQAQPDHADALHLLGLVHHHRGQHDVAHTLISRAIQLNPATSLLHNNLGEVCRLSGRLDEALTCYSKALSLQPVFPEALRNIGLTYAAQGKPEQAISHLHQVIERFPGYPGGYWALGFVLMDQKKADEAVDIYNKGLEHTPTELILLTAKGHALRTSGKLEDAIRHYHHMVDLYPGLSWVHHNLAMIFQTLGKVDEAIASLQNELRLDPHAESARHFLAALQKNTPDRAPASYVRETFDGCAEVFDNWLVDRLEYHIPSILSKVLTDKLGPNFAKKNILDLGCGTGLFGEEVRTIKDKMVGVDLSPRMIERARERGIYDQLIVGDLLDYLTEIKPNEFDIAAATDVFNYVGNLSPVFEQLARVLPAGGLFLFSLEAAPNSINGFVLDMTGRYQHSQQYIEGLCNQFGFDCLSYSESTLRMERGKPVEGLLYLLIKPQ